MGVIYDKAMSDTSRHPIKAYKHFNMIMEIDIAGAFIYNGIKELEAMESLYYESEIFMFLYNISVGIERLQKVLIVLSENILCEDIEEFEKSLITHSHQDLHDRIKEKIDMNFNSRQNSFLQVLNTFYNRCRYERFNIKGQYNYEKELLLDYINKNLNNELIERDMFVNEINTIHIKEVLGRVIGFISRTYYRSIYKIASKQNLYTYELRSGSKSQKVFLSQVRKNSLYNQLLNEQIAAKELLVFLINSKHKNGFYKFIKEIKPLKIDVALVNSYLESIFKGDIPNDLVDEMEYLYGEHNYSKDRIEMINCIGNSRIDFDFIIVESLREILESLIFNKCKIDTSVDKFLCIVEYLED